MSDDEADGGWALVVAFPDASESFTRGFEAGGIWEAMARSDPTIIKTVHVANEQVLNRMAHAQGYALTLADIGDGCWAEAVFTKVRPAKDSPIATGRLSVIDGGRGAEPPCSGESSRT